ncbi:MAG: uncharacterized protein JWP68_2543 [Modestobacter sp.]|nr:uncharacterized protein [Modestobacter sp.]
MNVWMKRALQTGLFTGGLLALGSGIASADESAVDVTVPVTVTDNALAVLGTAGTTPAEIQLPAVGGTIAAALGAITVAVPVTVGGNAADVAGIDIAQPAATPATGGSAGSAVDGSAVDADVPVTVTGNAVAALGEATAGGTAPAAAPAGNSDTAVDADVPVTACGNGIGVLGDATGNCTTSAGTPGNPGTPIAPAMPIPTMPIPTMPTPTAPTVSAPTVSAPTVSAPTVSGQPGTFPGVVTGTVPSASAGLQLSSDGSTRTDSTRTDSELAYTGSPVAALLLGSLLALALGLALTVVSRRRVSTLG